MRQRTYQEWANDLGLRPTAVHKWASGQTRISNASAKKLAEITGVPWHVIVEMDPGQMCLLLGKHKPANRADEPAQP